MSDFDNTISKESNLGKQLNKVSKAESLYIMFGDKNIPITTKISIGRDKNSDVVVDDSLASREHAIIQKIKEDYYIKDLNSTNGTLLNEENLPKDKYVKLNQKDVIQIGRIKLTIKKYIHK
jgi:hypothetical protein